jgi:hypothetical protein
MCPTDLDLRRMFVVDKCGDVVEFSRRFSSKQAVSIRLYPTVL